MKNKIKLKYAAQAIFKKINYTKRVRIVLAVLVSVCNSTYAIVSETATVSVQQMISGTITDATGEPIIGVTVLIKGTNIGVTSDFDGKYTIRASKRDKLVFTYLGMKTVEITVENNPVINVTLLEDSTQLDEVVVVGYGTKKKVNISGAVGSTSSKELENRPLTNVGQALQGTIANLNITTAGIPNNTPDYNIRGVQSISGGEPLIVIDGITATKSDLGMMSPNDIESVSVLKDAASASIYGSRASFGVILVTTKKAKTEKMSINVNVLSSINRITRQPELELDPYKVASFLDVMGVPWYDFFTEEDLEYAKQVSEGTAPATRLNPANPGKYQYFHSTNWRDEMLNKNTYMTNANMNISQKFDRGSYYMGVETQHNSGIYRYNTDDFQRYNLRLKASYDLTDWLTLSNNTWTYQYEYHESAYAGQTFFQQSMRQWSLNPLYNPDGTPTETNAILKGRLESGNWETKENGIQSTFAADIHFVEDKLKVHGDASFKKRFHLREANDTPAFFYEGPDSSPKIYGTSNPWASFMDQQQNWSNYNVYADYTNTFANKHYFHALAGYNQEEENYNQMYGDKANLISAQLPTVALATGEDNVAQSKYAWSVQGVFGRLNYIYDEKYIVEGNLRYDGSSRFPKEDRWVLSPSVSASWVVTKEGFMRNAPFSLLKFRASWGSLGNQGISSSYPYISSLGFGKISSLIDGAQPVAVYSPGLVSPTLTWETVETKNVGIDLGFFDHKLTASFDYFNRYTKNMLTSGKELPGVLGTSVPTENAADLVTKGWELALGWKDQLYIGKKPFSYGINFNLGDSRAWVEKFDNPVGSLGQYYKGQEFGEIWGLTTDGYFQTQEDIDFGPDQVKVTSYPGTRSLGPGDVRFKDINGDGVIDFGKQTLDDHGDLQIIGNDRPRYNFGLDLTAEWNGFDFRAFLQGIGKRDFYPGYGYTYYFWGAFSFPWSGVTKENYYNHWTPTNRDAFYPRLKSYVAEYAGSSYGPAEVSINQTRWLQNAAYMRMKNLTIGYSLPKDVSTKIGIGKLRLFLSGENLFEITKLFKYVDPEDPRGEAYPFQRTYSFGLNLTF